MLIVAPGARGCCGIMLAVLEMPPAATTGGSWFAPSPPATCFTPLIPPCALRAFTVMVTEPCPARVCQVASQRPFASGLRLKGGSPLENSATTEPDSSAAPQLSLTSTCNASGQPAGTAKPPPRDEIAGNNADGVQPASAWVPERFAAAAPDPAGVTMNVIPSVRTRPSENCSVSAQR